MVEVEWLFAVAPIAVFVVVIVIVVIIADFIVVVIVVVVALVRVVGVACPERGGGGSGIEILGIQEELFLRTVLRIPEFRICSEQFITRGKPLGPKPIFITH